MNKEKMSLDLLDEVEVELKRFQAKLRAARVRITKESASNGRLFTVNTKETGAVRRAALDLKNELTRITQSRSY